MSTKIFRPISTHSRGAVLGSAVAALWATLTLPAPIAQAAPSVIAPRCELSADKTLRCTSVADGPQLDFSFDVMTGDTGSTTYSTGEQRSPRATSIRTTSACGNLDITTAPDPAGGTLLSATGHCTTPARVCMNAQVSGPEINLRSGIAYIQGRGATLGIQSDERVSTEIMPAEKRIRFCTDPTRLTDIGWSLKLFAGTPDDVRTAFQRIPAPIKGPDGTIVGLSKTSPAVKDGYLFVDLTENNADTLLPIVKRAGFPYVLIYSSTWATSPGSYDFNKKNYPHELEGLKQVVRKANALGIKVGLHTMTSFVAKNDPIVSKTARTGLLKESQSELDADIDQSETRIVATNNRSSLPKTKSLSDGAKPGPDLMIDDEIISCPAIEKSTRDILSACKRGLYGTRAVAHKTGAPIQHLAERYGVYLVDLHTPLKKELAQRIGKIINEAGIDMVYLDGGEVGAANGEPGWFVAEQQIEILNQVHRPLFVEGSGITPRLWPYLTRIVDDDYAALATIDYLDAHKIGEAHKALQYILMPDNLGWLGLLKETSASPATTPEEIATYVARGLALDIPLSIQTTGNALNKNPYTVRLLDTLALGNRSLKSNALSGLTRARLSQDMWYYDVRFPHALRRIRPITFASNSVAAAQSAKATTDEQGIALRIRRIQQIDPDSTGNIILTGTDVATLTSLSPPTTVDARNRGVVAGSVAMNGRETGVRTVDLSPEKPSERRDMDLSRNRTLMVDFDYTPAVPDTHPTGCAIANLQLQDNRGNFRDYLLNLPAGKGQRAVLDYEHSAPAILRDLKPAANNYGIKQATYEFDFAHVTQLNVRWMAACGKDATLRINKITMLAEQPGTLSSLVLKANSTAYPIADSLTTGETLDVFPDGTLLRCKENVCSTSRIAWPSGPAVAGRSFQLKSSGKATAEITLSLLGEPTQVE